MLGQASDDNSNNYALIENAMRLLNQNDIQIGNQRNKQRSNRNQPSLSSSNIFQLPPALLDSNGEDPNEKKRDREARDGNDSGNNNDNNSEQRRIKPRF